MVNRALWDYPAMGPNELRFQRGDIINLIAKSNQDWWEGELHGQHGFFPANRVLELGAPVFRAFTAVPSPPNTSDAGDRDTVNGEVIISGSGIVSNNLNDQINVEELPVPPRKTSMPRAWPDPAVVVDEGPTGSSAFREPAAVTAPLPDSAAFQLNRQMTADIKSQLESLSMSVPLPPPLTVRTQSSSGRALFTEPVSSPPFQLPPLPPNNISAIPRPPDDVVDMVTPPRSNAVAVVIKKEGPLNYRNRSAGQKHLVRNWAGYWAELTDSAELRLFKDVKNMGRSPRDRPAFAIDLNRCQLDSSANLDKKRATFALLNLDTNEVFLLQAQSDMDMHAWAGTLISVCPTMRHEPFYADLMSSTSGSGILKKLKNHMANLSSSSLSSSLALSPPSQQTKDVTSSSLDIETKEWIKVKLFGFFKNRPSLDALQQKGIIPKDLIFGGTLESHIPKDSPLMVPLIVQRCIERIERHLETEGLYRLSGNSSSIQKLRIQVNSATDLMQVDFNAEELQDVNVITGLMKLYLRELKDPLLTLDRYWDFIEAGKLQNMDQRVARLQVLVSKLPDANYHTLKYIVHHLNNVRKHKDMNKMDSLNLAIVFGPTLLRPPVETMDTVMNIGFQNAVIDTLITYNDLFNK